MNYNVEIKTFKDHVQFKIYDKEIKGIKNKDTPEETQRKKYYSYLIRNYQDYHELITNEKITYSSVENEYNEKFNQFLEIYQDKLYKQYQQNLIEYKETNLEKKLREQKNLNDSVSRSKQQINDLGKANQWEYFLTFTFDDKKVDAQDYNDVTEKLKQWLKQTKSKYKDMKYIIVPEYSKRYHFHGLISGIPHELFTDSTKKTKQGNIIYNLDIYDLGFTTFTKIEKINNAVGYITKYVTKHLVQAVPKGKKKYWHSTNCERPYKKNLLMGTEDIKELKTILHNNNIYHKEIKVKTLEYQNKIQLYEIKRD